MRGNTEEGAIRRLAALAAPLVLALAFPATGLAEQAYPDPAGDAGGAPDVVGVTASNDAAGVIAFRVALAAPVGSDQAVFVDIDTDRNPATGGDGAEVTLSVEQGRAVFLRWNGSDFVESAAASFRASLDGSTATLAVGRGDIGVERALAFDVTTALYSPGGDPVAADNAPDAGTFAYELAFPQCANGADDDGDGKVDAADLGCSAPADDDESDDPVTLRAGTVRTAPVRPRAGKALLVSARFTRVETGRPVTTGRVACLLRVAGKTVRATGRFAAGRASCRLTVPRVAKRKLARGTITVTHLGRTAFAPFSFRVV